MTKMSILMDRENFEFLSAMTIEEKSDLSKAVRDLVTRGRVLLAVEKYKKGEASLGRAAEVAGVPVGQMMTLLREFGVWSRIDQEDYRQGLASLAKVWWGSRQIKVRSFPGPREQGTGGTLGVVFEASRPRQPAKTRV